MKAGFLTFGRDDLGYGMEIIRRELVAAGHECYRVTPKTARCCDVIMFSVFWFEHLFLLADFLRRAGIEKKQKDRPRIIVGGFCTFNPVPMLCYADAVVVGDGEGIVTAVVSGDYSAKSVLCDGKDSVTWGNSELNPICHETNGVARIELARGCRARCAFCAVAHLKPYREASVDAIEKCLNETRLKRVSLFAPEPTMHSRDTEINMLCRLNRKQRQDSDVRLDRLDKRSDSVPRVGIEGLSERLRLLVKKPYQDETIIAAIERAIKDRRKGLFMYMILDLPGECEDDWSQFGNLLRKIGEIKGAEKFLLKPSPSVFMPTPHTPMAGCAINWDRDCGKMWEEFFGRGKNRVWLVMMAERSRVFSPHMRLLQMMATRAGSEFSEKEAEMHGKGVIKISSGRLTVANKTGVEKALQSDGLISKYCGERSFGPWDIVKMKEDKCLT